MRKENVSVSSDMTVRCGVEMTTSEMWLIYVLSAEESSEEGGRWFAIVEIRDPGNSILFQEQKGPVPDWGPKKN